MKTILQNYRLLILLLLFVSSIFSCSEKKTTENAKKKYVKTFVVKENQSENFEMFPGVLKENKEVKLSFRIAGPIDKLPVKEGQYIKKGELIARINPRDYQLQYNAAKAEYDQVIDEVKRYEKMYSENSITDNDYKKAISGKKQITAKMNAAQNALNDTRLVAPFDGYAQTLFVSKGEITDAGMPIVSIINTSSLIIEAPIPDNAYINKNRFNDFYCTNRNYPGRKIPVHFIGINAKSGINKLYKMSLLVTVPDDIVLAPGMNVQVHFSWDKNTNQTIKIPLNACFERDNKTYVYKYENKQAVKTEVQVGEINRNNEISIISGLKNNDVIIAAGISKIIDGQKIEPINNKK